VASAIAHKQLRTGETVTAYHALRRAHPLNRVQAVRADRDPGNVVKRNAAQTAVRREEDRENAAQKASKGREKDGTSVSALFSSFAL